MVTQNLLTQLEFGWKQCSGQLMGPWTQVCQTVWHLGSHDGISTFQLNVSFYHDSSEGIFSLLNAGIGKILVLFFHLHLPVLVVSGHYASPGFYIYAEDPLALVKSKERHYWRYTDSEELNNTPYTVEIFFLKASVQNWSNLLTQFM